MDIQPAPAPESRKFPIAQIKPSPFQARKIFEEGPLQNLAESMKVGGLDQPIGIRLLPDGSGELLFGERRLRAAKLLGWTEIDARVWSAGLNDQDAATKGLIENLQREDLNPIEQAKGFKQLADRGMDNAAIGRALGKAREVISRHLDLLDLPAEVQESVTRGTLTERHTRSIRQIPDKTKQIEVAQQIIKEGWSVNETEKRVKKLLNDVHPNGVSRILDPLALNPSLASDPMGQKWSQVDLGDQLKRNAPWAVSYTAPLTWNFQVKLQGGDPSMMLSSWFDAMKEAMDKILKQESEANITDEDRQREAQWHAEEMARRRIRLPQNETEEAELQAEAQKSPQAFYAWVYNPEMAEVMKGKAWIHMGFETWEAGYKTLLDLARQDAKENEEEDTAWKAEHPAQPAPQNQK